MAPFLGSLALLSVLAASASAAPLLLPRDDGNCVVTLPANALSATGLSTPWIVSGAGCTQTADGMPTFAECTVVDPATGALSVYSPLLINKGQAFVKPVVPTLPANAVVGCWFGTNGMTTTLADNNNGKDLAAANCVNGAPGVKGDIFGQFAACNAAQFFTAANKATLNIPALGTSPKNMKPCYTTRSFEVVDMDQSDNVITTYSLDKNGKIGQKTAINSKTLTIDINNGSDNLLLDLFLRPVLGCTAFTAPNLADPGVTVGSLALNELQAAKFQAAPIALVPPNDPMVLTTAAAAMSQAKQNAYRAATDQGTGTGATPEALTYCQNYLAVNAPSIITDAKFTKGFTTPDPANGVDLYTFLGQRFAASWAGLGCDALDKNVVYLNPKVMLPIIANRDGNGVTQSLTFNTASLLALAQQNGLVTGTATTAKNNAQTTKAATATATAAVNAPKYVISLTQATCWGANPVNFIVNMMVSVNGVHPANDMNGGLAALKLAFNDLKDIAISSTWNMGVPKTSGNALMFETLNDQPNPGGIFTTNSATCNNGVLTPPIKNVAFTGALLTGGAINPTLKIA
ncbi:hypothetical protein HDU93_001026 [Gonapodya sp. JEL0774]|nr:hypothetical protein HDU93_001026 [Gonapodya sp. JEL0774]